MEAKRNYTCAVVPCASYDDSLPAMTRALEAIDGLDFVKPGMRIVIKANLVAPMAPDSCATTHPKLLIALTKLLSERGAHVIVGDSPGGVWNSAALSAVYRATGMHEVEAAGAELNRNTDSHTVNIEGKTMRRLTYTDYLDDCDAIIDFAKLKSHGMVGLSGAVKNMYGVIPGLIKPQTHYLYPDVNDFADMIVDINEHFKPRLALIDAVWGMEGNGPTAGTPRHIGALIAARSVYEADAVAAHLIGLDSQGVPTLAAAVRRGLCTNELSDIALYGDPEPLAVRDFKKVPRRSTAFLKGTRLDFLSGTVAKALEQRPQLKRSKCVACKKCFNICPAKAITMVKKGDKSYPRIDRAKCIRCFCCQEFCPKAAMVVHRSVIVRLLQKRPS